MKIMLCLAPWDLWEQEEDTMYPLGLAYLGAILEKHGHTTELLNLTNSNWDKIKFSAEKKIKEFNPDVFGISILSNSRVSTKKVLTLVRKISPKIIIIAGGVHTTFLYEQILNYYPVDYAVLGEADYTILDLIEAIEKKKPLSFFRKIKGIAFKNKNEIITNCSQERIKNLDLLPFPKHEYFQNIIKKNKIAYIMSSRGCPFNCTFCPSSAYWGRRMVQRSAENVFEEMLYLKKKFPEIEIIRFLDDEFVVNNQRVIEICKLIIKNNFKIAWGCLGRASSMNEELLKWMKKAGCFEITFGVESGSQRILDRIGKKVRIKQIIDTFKLCKQYKINTRCLTMVGNIGENSESVKETIKLAKILKIRTEPAILIVFPGTEVYKVAKQKGFLDDTYWLGQGLPPLFNVEHPKYKLWWWSFKTGLITNFYADDGDLNGFLKMKFLNKINSHNFLRIFKRYVSDKF
ncbi:MAG: B12-binding domain-containing radical SAM protein [Nanoarchaeota archaeon]|nr:B12-binding domain-containing radical SAM protein [Nanoarchaeota archaeon]MBU1028057.1 B12-binding domain-containing radical SAM protein [Nanoarchaeota archaeon]